MRLKLATGSTLMVLLGGLGLAALGCAVNPTSPDDHPANVPQENPVMAIVEYGGGVDYSDPAIIAQYSRARVLVVQAPLMWRDDVFQGAVAALKRANPDLKVIGYVNAHTTWLDWGDETKIDPAVEPYKADWDEALRPFWSYTTTGDTMTSWPGKIVVNVLDPACREAMVQVLAKHWSSHGNVLDGIFWDHFNEFLWVSTTIPGRDGEMDLDGDGITHRSDLEEMQAYRDASDAMILRTREVLGDHVIQITNGNRAARDSSFANLVDGTMYERFPEVGFFGERMRQALDLTEPNNLFAANKWPRTRNGGPFLILSNTGVVRYTTPENGYESALKSEFNRVVALLTGTLVAYHPEDQSTHYGWPEIEVDLGDPLGPAQINLESISREFENGTVSLDLTGGTDYLPFSYEIVQDGKIVQSLAIPTDQP